MNPLKDFNPILMKVRAKNATRRADCIQYHQNGVSPISCPQRMDERELAVSMLIQATMDNEVRGEVKESRVLSPVIVAPYEI